MNSINLNNTMEAQTGKHAILIAEDHEIVRLGLRYWVKLISPEAAVYEVSTYEGLRDILGQRVFNHLILDLQLYGQNMLEKLPYIRNSHPELSIMIYSMASRDLYKNALQDMGLGRFLSKASSEADTLAALRQFLSYNDYMKELIAQRELAAGLSNPQRDVFFKLSLRERQMAGLFLKGETAKQIQYELKLKSSTVSTLKRRILCKLKISNITELIKLAYERGPV